MKKNVTMLIRIMVVVFLIILFFVSQAVTIEKKKQPKESDLVYEQGYVSDGGEVGPVDGLVEGDPGVDDEGEMNVFTAVPTGEQEQTRDNMKAFILEYLGYIPFADGGRFYGVGYFKSPDGVDNRIQEPVGMDSLGYVIWVYRNIFGTVSEDFEDPLSLYRKSEKVAVDNLKIGDIGMYSDQEGERNHFGIFVGYDYGIPVFAHCSGNAVPKYPCGNDRLSFLRSSANDYYLGNAPVDLYLFFRPNVPWLEEVGS